MSKSTYLGGTVDVETTWDAIQEWSSRNTTFIKDLAMGRSTWAVTPGMDFDPRRGAQTLRFSYARATADIREGLARLKAFMSRR